MSPRLPTPAFALGQLVYQRAAPETGGFITGILCRPGGAMLYLVTWDVDKCSDETQHWELELTDTKAFGTGEGA